MDEPLHPQYDHPGDAIESHPPYDAKTNRINMPKNVESINTINNNIIRIKKLAGIV